MSEYQVSTRICDDDGTNCQAAVWIPSTEIPTNSGWFGLVPGSTEYNQIVIGFTVLMATVWTIKVIGRFLVRR